MRVKESSLVKDDVSEAKKYLMLPQNPYPKNMRSIVADENDRCQLSQAAVHTSTRCLGLVVLRNEAKMNFRLLVTKTNRRLWVFFNFDL